MGTCSRFGGAGAGGQPVNGVVCEDEAEAGLVGSVVVDGELERVVELALDSFRGLGDVYGLQDREGVEEIDGLLGLDHGCRHQVVQLSDLGGAVGFEGVEAAAEPVAEGAVGGFQFLDEPVLPGGQVRDLLPQRRRAPRFGLLAFAGRTGEAAPEVGVPVGAEDARGDDEAKGLDERVLTDVDCRGAEGARHLARRGPNGAHGDQPGAAPQRLILTALCCADQLRHTVRVE
jgi:hypothetical protein